MVIRSLMRASPSWPRWMCNCTHFSQSSDSSKSVQTGLESNSQSVVRYNLFIDKLTDDPVNMGNIIVHNDETVSQNVERVTDQVCTLIQGDG